MELENCLPMQQSISLPMRETETTHYKISKSEVYQLLLFTIDRNNYFFADVGEEYFFFSSLKTERDFWLFL